MNTINPHFFSAILDGMKHRFLLVLECETIQGMMEQLPYCPPRFSVGNVNATKDPRLCAQKQLMELGVDCETLHIPHVLVMAHQYMYVLSANTDEFGWQYRSSWQFGPLSPREEPWIRTQQSSSTVRRRLWMSTLVQREQLATAKRLLSENIRFHSSNNNNNNNSSSYSNGNSNSSSDAVIMEGELMRYEKGTITKSWQRRRVLLRHNRLEFYSISNNNSNNSGVKKAEVSLADCEVKILFERQCSGRQCAFSLRNPLGSVSVLLDADSSDSRRCWVLAIQHQLAINYPDVNFPPLEYGPPTGEYPDNRVLLCCDLMLQSRDRITGDNIWTPRHFQLRPHEILYFESSNNSNYNNGSSNNDSSNNNNNNNVAAAAAAAAVGGEVLAGRLFVEGAEIIGEERNLNFQITSASGITLYLSASSPEDKNMWLLGLRRQLQQLENQKQRQRSAPKEEQRSLHDVAVSDRIAVYYDDRWTAPAVEGEDEDYLQRVFDAPYAPDPDAVEFTEFVQGEGHPTALRQQQQQLYSRAEVKDNEQQAERMAAMGMMQVRSASSKSIQSNSNDPPAAAATATAATTSTASTAAAAANVAAMSHQSSFAITSERMGLTTAASVNLSNLERQKSTSRSFISRDSNSALLASHRALINPKFILKVLKGITHRFLLVLESESRLPDSCLAAATTTTVSPQFANTASKQVARFTVGGPRASKDPRTTPLNELLPISNTRPEIQLPPGWVMVHQYIYIVQQNTDDNGWQYRSTWSDGALSSKDEQWTEQQDDDKHTVRRRLWMTTVVKKDEVLRCKKLLHEQLNTVRKDPIMQGSVYRYHSELGRLSSSWQRRRMLLYHSHVEFLIGNEKKGSASLENCEVKLLFGEQCPGRSYAFAVRSANLSTNLLLEADSEEARLQWVRAIKYQLAVNAADVNFAPFEYGPPTGDVSENRILLCGDLEKIDDTTTATTSATSAAAVGVKMHFQLKPYDLCLLRKDQLLWRLQLAGAVVKTSAATADVGTEFSVLTSSGVELQLRADSAEARISWTRALKRQVLWIQYQQQRLETTPAEERVDDGLSYFERQQRYHDWQQWTAAVEADEEQEERFLLAHEDVQQQLRCTEVWDGETRAFTPVATSANRRPSSMCSSESSSHNGSFLSPPPVAPVAPPVAATTAAAAVQPGGRSVAAQLLMQEDSEKWQPRSTAAASVAATRQQPPQQQQQRAFSESKSFDSNDEKEDHREQQQHYWQQQQQQQQLQQQQQRWQQQSQSRSNDSADGFGAASNSDKLQQLRRSTSEADVSVEEYYSSEDGKEDDVGGGNEHGEGDFGGFEMGDGLDPQQRQQHQQQQQREQESGVAFEAELERLKSLRRRQSMLAMGEVKTHVTRIMQGVEKSTSVKSPVQSSKSHRNASIG